MPEGDSIHKVARALAPHLLGRAIEGLYLRDYSRDEGWVRALEGKEVRSVEAIGKHLVIAFADRFLLRMHFGMKGRYRREARKRGEEGRPSPSVSVLIRGEASDFLFRELKEQALSRPPAGREAKALPALRRLGPDLLGEALDLEEVLRRARARPPETPMAVLLLDQSVAAGIGNVYKCELLFLHRLHPSAPLGEVPEAKLRAIFDDARQLLQKNLRQGPRITVSNSYVGRLEHGLEARGGAPRHYVYGRLRRPCLRCRAAIRSLRIGDHARVTFYCPRCQARV